jgi:hypothetical protein
MYVVLFWVHVTCTVIGQGAVVSGSVLSCEGCATVAYHPCLPRAPASQLLRLTSCQHSFISTRSFPQSFGFPAVTMWRLSHHHHHPTHALCVTLTPHPTPPFPAYLTFSP